LYLAGFAEPTRLDAQRGPARPDGPPRRESSLWFDLARTIELYQGAKAVDTPVDDLARAAWGLVLCAQCASDDVVFGTTTDGSVPIPIRVRLAHAQPVGDYLAKVREDHRQGRRQAPLAAEEFAACAGLPAGTDLFGTVVRCGRTPWSGVAPPYAVELVVECGSRFGLAVRHSADQLTQEDARGLLELTSRTMAALATTPGAAPLGELAVLTTA
jgi:hypothetical protein